MTFQIRPLSIKSPSPGRCHIGGRSQSFGFGSQEEGGGGDRFKEKGGLIQGRSFFANLEFGEVLAAGWWWGTIWS